MNKFNTITPTCFKKQNRTLPNTGQTHPRMYSLTHTHSNPLIIYYYYIRHISRYSGHCLFTISSMDSIHTRSGRFLPFTFSVHGSAHLQTPQFHSKAKLKRLWKVEDNRKIDAVINSSLVHREFKLLRQKDLSAEGWTVSLVESFPVYSAPNDGPSFKNPFLAVY